MDRESDSEDYFGLARKLERVLRDAGWSEEYVLRMSENPEFCLNLREVLDGVAEIRRLVHLVELDADPVLPPEWQAYNDNPENVGEWEIAEHVYGSRIIWMPESVRLHWEPEQMSGENIKGETLYERVIEELPYNSNLLDFWLQHQETIPDEYEGLCIFCMGTTYRSPNGDMFVRYIYRDGKLWKGHHLSLNDQLDAADRVAMRANCL